MPASERDVRAKKRERQRIVTTCTSDIDNALQLLSKPTENTQSLLTALHALQFDIDTLQKCDDFLRENVPDDEVDNVIDKAYEQLDKIQKAMSQIRGALDKLKADEAKSAAATAAASAAATTSAQPSTTDTDTKINARLPKLEIEKYNGDPLKFQEFWDHFDSTIEKSKLPTIDKYKYLKSYLEGDALKVAEGFALVEANYRTVVDSLKSRFGNRQLAIFIHLTKLLNMPALKNHDTAKIQEMYDEFECHVRSLVSLQLDESTFGQVFAPILLNKLPPFVQMELHRKLGDDVWNLDKQRNVLRDEIRLRQMSFWTFNFTETNHSSNSSHADQPNKFSNGQGKPKNGKPKSSASMLTAAAGGPSKGQKWPRACIFCGQDHAHEQCTKIPDAESRKRKIVGHCYNCLRNNHMSKACKDTRKCKHCNRKHHSALCDQQFPNVCQMGSAVAGTGHVQANVTAAEPVVTSSLVAQSTRCTHMQTAIAELRDPTHQVQYQGRLLFDTGGSRTYITRGLSRQLGLQPVGREVISVAGFGEKFRKTQSNDVVEFDVCLKNGTFQRVRACVTDVITCPVEKQPINSLTYPLVDQLPLAEPLVRNTTMLQIDVLIGNDYYYNFVDGGFVHYPDGLAFIGSKLGFLTSGTSLAAPSDRPQQLCSLLYTQQAHHGEGLNFNVERFWSLEDIGIKDEKSLSSDDQALELFTKTISRLSDGRYQVGWPWKDDSTDIPDNYKLAKGRLRSLLKRIGGDPELLATYDKTIQYQKEKGIVEPAPKKPDGPRVNYIPHHCVIKPQKTTKVRVVYDASAKCAKNVKSLNEQMHRGPVMLSDLCGMLMRFQLKAVVMVADIEKAFLQVELRLEDRDAARFFWLKDITKPPSEDNVDELRFRRVLFGITASPFMLSGTIRFHLSHYDSPLAKEIEDNLYVDNIIIRCDSPKQAKQAYSEGKSIFQDAQMNLREWYTNSVEVHRHIAVPDKRDNEVTTVLGLHWSTKQDSLTCSPAKVLGGAGSKRIILQSCASLFDPCGVLSPISIRGKCLMQQLWKAKCDWDDPLPQELEAEWTKLKDDLLDVHRVKFPRFIGTAGQPVSLESCQLHCFTDASIKAYAAVIFLKFRQGKTVVSQQIFAKSRVAPLHEHFTPRLELMGVVIGTRCLNYVKTELRLPQAEMFLWTDSTCVLQWLEKQSISTVFVQNRIKEIQQHKDVTFGYVPSAQNPADVATKGTSVSNLSEMDLWWHGPTWLLRDSNNWPKFPKDSIPPKLEADFASGKTGGTKLEADFASGFEGKNGVAALANVTVVSSQTGLESLGWIERFSSLGRLRRAAGWMFRFVKNAKLTREKRQFGMLTATEIENAAVKLDALVQKANYPGLFSGNQSRSEKSLKFQLNLFLAPDGLIRLKSRQAQLGLADSEIFPKLLNANNHYSELVVRHYHEKARHFGSSHTLGLLRKEYWLPAGRSVAKRVCHRCFLCRKLKGGAYTAPPFAPLPAERGSVCYPFWSVGIDYMGPLLIRDGTAGDKKVWICLFTCAVVRAVHLEVVTDLTTEQFLFALRRFCALRSTPKVVFSDNAKNFRSGNTFLAKTIASIEKSGQLKSFLAISGIEWRFITERAPWMGGFYERLVGVVKQSLISSIHKSKLTLTELQTLVTELAATVNTRPLLYVGADDLAGLTPAHFLLQSKPILPHTLAEFPDTYQDAPSRQQELLVLGWKRLRACQEKFWNVWRRQYLTSLLGQRYRFKERNTVPREPSVGDIVHVGDQSSRLSWPMGKVSQVLRSADGMVRSAYVQTSGQKTIKRPIRLLYPLEINAGNAADIIEQARVPASAATQPSASAASVRSARPRRAKAVEGENLRRQLCRDSSDSE